MDDFNVSDVSSLDITTSIHPALVTITIVMIVVGIFGNTLALVVLCRKRLRNINIGIFLIVFCLTDLLIVALLMYRMLSDIFLQEAHFNEFMCEYTQFLIFFVRQFSSWITVAISVHRTFAISRPFSARMKSFGWKSQIVTIVAIAIILLIFNTVHSRYFHFRHGFCIHEGNKITFVLLSGAFYNFLPIFLLIISTVTIITTLCRRPKSWASLKTNNNILLILTVNVMYLICSLPLSFVFPFLNMNVAENLTIKYVMILLSNVDNTFHFVLYMLTGQLFREEFKKIVRQVQPCASSTFESIKRGSPYVISGQNRKLDRIEKVENKNALHTSKGV